MSSRTTRSNPDDDSRRRRPPAKKQNGATAGLLFALAVVAIGAAGWLNRAKLTGSSSASTEGGAGAKPVESPFASIPEELPPVRGGGGSAKAMTSRAPTSLLQDPVWTAALEASKGAYLLAQEAEEAQRAKDNSKYLKKAVAAREAFDQVIIDTAVWEEELVQQYGDNDQVVSQIMRERQRWFGFLRKYHGLRDE